MTLPARYVNVRPIVPGTNAAVFAATDTLLARDVFLKIYAIDGVDPSSALREPQLLTRLAHPQLVSIYRADQIDWEGAPSLLLEMEYLRDGTVREVIEDSRSTGTWPRIFEVLDLVRSACAGLDHLHGEGIVHRDIKPANILVRRTNGRLQPVIADLGLAARINKDGRAHGSKYARMFRPPEVWRGLGHSTRSDIYQLGVVLYQLLCGHMDFSLSKLPDNELENVILNRMHIEIDSLGPHVERNLRKIIDISTADESDRFETMSELANELTSCRTDHPNWLYWRASGVDFIERENEKGLPVRYEIRSNGKRHEVRRLRKTHAGGFAQHGCLSIEHPALVRCKTFRDFVNNNGTRSK